MEQLGKLAEDGPILRCQIHRVSADGSPKISHKLRYLAYLGGGFKYFLFSPRKLGKIFNLTSIFFSDGWFNHQPVFSLTSTTFCSRDLRFAIIKLRFISMEIGFLTFFVHLPWGKGGRFFVPPKFCCHTSELF